MEELILVLQEKGLTLDQYEEILKLISDKKEKINDLDWSEISNKYGLGLHGDSLRKMNDGLFGGYYVKKYYDSKLISDTLIKSEDEYLKELDAKKVEIIKERKKLQATKLEMNRLYTHEARFELFYENLKEAFMMEPNPVFEPIQIGDTRKKYVLGISDIHYGANFKSEYNSYSIAECERRFEVLLAQTIKFIQKEKIDHLQVLNGADSLQGIIRMTDLKLNEVAVMKALVGVSKLLTTFLKELSKYCYVEYMHTGRANHTQTRPLGSKASELANEDMEQVIIHYIHDALEDNERVKVHMTADSDRVLFKIFDFECILMHGHQIKSIQSCARDLSFFHKRSFDYIILGHTHASQSIVVGESGVNAEVLTIPSLIGSDPYSDSFFAGAKGMAQIYTFDEKYGHTDTKNIILN